MSGIKDGLNREITKFTKELKVSGVTTLTPKVAGAYSYTDATNDVIVLTADKAVSDSSVSTLSNWIVETKNW